MTGCAGRGTGWPVGWSNPNPAGRKVGDTLALAQLLYGPLVDLGHGIYQRAEPFGSAFHLCFQVQDQTITKIGLYNNLWGMEG